MALLMRKNCARPAFVSSSSWVVTAFRFFEYFFGRELNADGKTFKIRPEAASLKFYDKERHVWVVVRKFYTVEALLAHAEGVVRAFFKRPELGFKFVRVPQLALSYGLDVPVLPIFSFAIAFDAADNVAYQGSSSTISLAHTVTGADPLILTKTRQQQKRAEGTATYNSVNMTRTDAYIDTDVRHSLWILPACDTGTHDATQTCSGGTAEWVIASVSYSGCAGTGQPDAHTSGSGSSAAPSSAVTVVASNCWAFSSVFPSNGSIAAGTNVTGRGSSYVGYDWYGDSNGTVATGSYTQAWTCSSGSWSIIQVSIAPQTAPPIVYGISGVVTLSGAPVEGATVRCIRQSDNVALAAQTTDSSGAYLFEDLDDAELYHLAVEYEDDPDKYNALSLWDVAPLELE